MCSKGMNYKGMPRVCPSGAGRGIISSALSEHASLSRECDQQKVPVLALLKRGPWYKCPPQSPEMFPSWPQACRAWGQETLNESGWSWVLAQILRATGKPYRAPGTKKKKNNQNQTHFGKFLCAQIHNENNDYIITYNRIPAASISVSYIEQSHLYMVYTT